MFRKFNSSDKKLTLSDKLQFCINNTYKLSDSEIFQTLGIRYGIQYGHCCTTAEIISVDFKLSLDYIFSQYAREQDCYSPDDVLNILGCCRSLSTDAKTAINKLYEKLAELDETNQATNLD